MKDKLSVKEDEESKIKMFNQYNKFKQVHIYELYIRYLGEYTDCEKLTEETALPWSSGEYNLLSESTEFSLPLIY